MPTYRAHPEFYDAEYEGNEDLERDVPFLLEELGDAPLDVLELACGTGRATLPLAAAGHRVVGIDVDPAMLAQAAAKRDAAGVSIELLEADALTLNLGRQFDRVVLIFNTFLAFTTPEQQDALLANVKKHLRPDGTFWIDVFFPNLPLLAEGHADGIEPHVFYAPSLGRSVFRETEVRQDLVNQIQHVTFHYLWHDDAGDEQRAENAFDLTWMFPRELAGLLARHGLHITRSFGGYDGGPLDEDSQRMIVEAASL